MNRDSHSRRKFFKEAAKKALPMIGAIILISNPVIAKVTDSNPLGCENSCYGSCTGSCTGSCAVRCTGCTGSCSGCTGSCSGSCSASSK